MARRASPTATEGYGWTYADKVAAVCLLALLDRSSVVGTDLGVVTKVQFGQRTEGWHFDDILLTTDDLGTERKVGISVKSASYISESGLDSELARLVWLQIEDGSPLDEETDALVLTQPSAAPAVHKALAEIDRWSKRQEMGQAEARISAAGVGNDLKRSILQSVRLGDGRNDAQRFFRVFRPVFLDLDPPYDQTAEAALKECLSVLRNPSEKRAMQLWSHLCQIAADGRGSAATHDLDSLLAQVTPHFDLLEHPRVRQDVVKLRRLSKDRHIPSVIDTIGGELRIATAAAQEQLLGGLQSIQSCFSLV